MKVNPILKTMQASAQTLTSKKTAGQGVSLTGQQISEVYNAIYAGFMNKTLPQTVAKLKATCPERVPVIDSFADVFLKATK